MGRPALLIALLVLLVAPAARAAPPPPPPREGRAVWVTRWQADTPAKVRRAIDYLAAHHLNMLILQVYGDGMALYPSRVAPRSPLTAGGFDPLEAACRWTRGTGIEVHAWLNVANVYSGGLDPPADPLHLVIAHPEWALVNARGTSLAGNVGRADTTVWFCPAQAGFRAYLGEVAAEIARAYPVAGIHLDYIRYPGHGYCYCPEHRARVREATGGEPSEGDPTFEEIRYADVTGMVRAIREGIDRARPHVALSAAVTLRGEENLQRADRWLEEGILDIAFPMLYTGDLDLFRERTAWFVEHSGGRAILPGIAASAGAIEAEWAIAREAGAAGAAIFSLGELGAGETAALDRLLAEPAAPPALPWLDGSSDRSPPRIGEMRVEGAYGHAVDLSWHTDEETTGVLGYAADGAAREVTVRERAFEHRVTLEGLPAQTTYRWQVAARDRAGNRATSAEAEFTTCAEGEASIIVDDAGPRFSRTGVWERGTSAGGLAGGYIYAGTSTARSALAAWEAPIREAGTYEVSVRYVAGSNRSGAAAYTVSHAGGETSVAVDQSAEGERWVSLGRFEYAAGAAARVVLSNEGPPDRVVIADAVRWARGAP